MMTALPFTLPPANEATTTPERRGLARDGVRLLVTDLAKRTQHEAMFRELPWFLRRGDLVEQQRYQIFEAGHLETAKQRDRGAADSGLDALKRRDHVICEVHRIAIVLVER